jgi:peptidoglycan/xylan/chitin deacetylase (PgdA/CDA1 family)
MKHLGLVGVGTLYHHYLTKMSKNQKLEEEIQEAVKELKRVLVKYEYSTGEEEKKYFKLVEIAKDEVATLRQENKRGNLIF